MVSIIIFIIAIFVSIDLGMNFANSLVPEFNDGISSRSILQALFGIFGNTGWTQINFFFAFEKSLWISFFLFVENIVVWILTFCSKKSSAS